MSEKKVNFNPETDKYYQKNLKDAISKNDPNEKSKLKKLLSMTSVENIAKISMESNIENAYGIAVTQDETEIVILSPKKKKFEIDFDKFINTDIKTEK